MRYFFDIRSPKAQTVDDTECDFPDRDRMKTEAVQALAQIAAEELPNGRVFQISVRDQDGTETFRALLTLDSHDIAAD